MEQAASTHEAAMVEALASLPTDPADPNSYSVVPVNAWSHNLSSVARVVSALRRRGGFEVVSPADLLERLAERTARQQQCPMPSGPWAGQCLSCTLSGNGTCLLACSDCGGHAASCDLSVCADGLRVNAEHQFMCSDGRVCPAKLSPHEPRLA